MSYYEQVAEKREPVVQIQAVIKDESKKREENEAEHLDEKLVREEKYQDAEYMHLNFVENELLAKKK